MAAPMTPVKIYNTSNVCVVCGFSFVLKKIDNEGKVTIQKFLDKKLKLTPERIGLVKNVCDIGDMCFPSDSGVCQTCFRNVEKVLKLENNAKTLRENLRSNLQSTMERFSFCALSPSKLSMIRIKREIEGSPRIDFKRTKAEAPLKPLLPVRKVTPVKLRPLHVPINTCSREVELPQPVTFGQPGCSAYVPIAPKTKQVPDDKENKRPARKSLSFVTIKDNPSEDIEKQIEKSCSPFIQGQGEVEVSINYPSGKKSVLVVSPSHKVICKAIVDNKNVDKTIVNTLCQQNPDIVVNAVAKLMEDECRKICHRGSGSFLQKKDYEDFINFQWENLCQDLQNRCPHTVSIISSMVQNPPPVICSKPFFHVMLSSAICLHGRNQEMSALHYMTAFILARGGCTQRTIESLCKVGLCVHPQTLHNKLTSWQDKLDEELKTLKIKWTNKEEVPQKYQLVGDNWDKDILPSYRTSERKTESLHLFQIYAIVDRYSTTSPVGSSGYEENITYIPSLLEQTQLLKELTFVFASAIIRHVPQVSKHFEKIFPKHLDHEHSAFAGIKTTQYSLGLFDTNENKTDEVIRLLRHLTDLYVPLENEEVVDAVFFGGDRLTDERIQCAQVALKDSLTSKGRLEGFISKSEDFHRLMNFLEAIYKLTYSTSMAGDPCTAHYYRNLLGHRSAKGPVKNAYRAYKMLYYTILDAICVVLFMDKLGSVDMNDLPLPDFSQMRPNDSLQWLNDVCRELVEKWFFEDGQDICEEIRSVLENPQHEENYWTSTLENGRFKCHHCEKDYKRVSSLKAHESGTHDVSLSQGKKKSKCSSDELHDYVLMLFKLIMLHRNFDSAVDMGDGGRCVRSAKYELPIYHKTNKIKYSICSIHTTALSSGLLNADQEERFIVNRFVNIQGGKNNNIALDEYIEMLNRDSKASCTGHKTKESILKHSKEYPLLVQFTKQFEEAGDFGQRKGFHHLPSYATDVEKVVKDLLENNILQIDENRKLKVKTTGLDRNPFSNCSQGLSTMLHRHRPWSPYGRLRDCKF